MDDPKIPSSAPLTPSAAEGLDPRQRMIVTTAKLLQRQGYHATGLKQVVEEAGAPRGSIYHHFPGGKDQLVVEALRVASTELTRAIADARRTEDSPAAIVERLGASLQRWLERSGFVEGCPVSTVTLEAAPRHPEITEACREAYDRWIGLFADALLMRGRTEHDARALATTVVAGLEGALLLSRAHRSTAPLSSTCAHLAALVADAPSS